MGCCVTFFMWLWAALILGFDKVVADLKWKIIGLAIILVVGGIIFGIAYFHDKKKGQACKKDQGNIESSNKNEDV